MDVLTTQTEGRDKIMKFNRIIKNALLKRKIIPSKMARDLRIDQGQLSKFLNYGIEVGTKNLGKIFDYLKISLKIDDI